MRKLIQDARKLGTGVLGGLLLGSFRSLILLRFLGPELVGPWRSAMLVHSFGEFARLGAIRGVGLRVPVLDGQGDKAEADRMAQAGGSFALAVGLLLGLATLAISMFVEEPNTKLALRFIAVVITTAQPGYFLEELAIARHRFTLRAREAVLEGSVNLTGCLLLAAPFGIFGVGISSVTASILGLLILWRGTGFRFTLVKDWIRTKLLVKEGLPFALSEGGFEMLRRLDILVMALVLGPVIVGYYGISLLIMDFSLMFARGAVAQVLSPHLLRKFGETGSFSEVAIYYEVPARLFSYTLPVLLGLGACLLPPIIPLILPQYENGVPAAQITMWSLAFVALHSSISSFLVAAKRIPSVLRIFFGLLPVAALGQWVVLSSGMGLEGAAWVTFCTLGVAACGELALAQRQVGRSGAQILMYLTSLVLPLVIAIGCFDLARTAAAGMAPPGVWMRAVFHAGLFAGFYSPVLLAYEYHFSMLRMVREAQ